MANLDHIYNPDERVRAFENQTTGYLISLAGPGTGKSFSFLKRITALSARRVSQNAVCYLTFVKEISNAFIQDYVQEFTKESYDLNKPRISTLHSFACRLLRNQGFQIGYDGELFFINTIDTDTDAANILLEDLLPFINEPSCRTVPQLRTQMGQIKAGWRDTEDPSSLPEPIPKILAQAEILFRALRVIDWDQTIPLTHQLATSMATLPRWITDIEHYLIDEFQDFNRAEQSLIDFLANHAMSTVIVGDDDQSLYRSRGGSPSGLQSLYADTSKDQVSLVKCHRCREAIVVAANTFQRVMHANPRALVPVKPAGQVLAYRFKSSKAELAFLVTFLQECIAQLPEAPSPKDGTICLFPSWRVLDEYFKQLSTSLPCTKRRPPPDPQRIWLERALNLICRPGQRFLERLLLTSYGEIKPRHTELIVRRVIDDDIPLLRAVQLVLAEHRFTGDAATQAQQFCQFTEDMGSRDGNRISAHLSAKLSTDAAMTLQHVTMLLSRIDQPETEDLINEFADLILPSSVLPEEDPRSILFLTMHGSKGLTKRVVVMPGLESAWLPGESTGDELEEKRRLFFVALTRATDRVLFTIPKYRAKGDTLNFNVPGRGVPSPFIANSGVRVVYHD